MNLNFDLQLVLPGLAGAGLLVWLLLTADRRRWWPSQWSLHLDAAAKELTPGDRGEVTVVIPARNEAPTLPRSLPRLLKQADWFRKVVLVDDRSTDQTSSVTHRLAAGTPAEGKVEIVRVDEIEEGWSAKLNALRAGLEHACAGWRGDTSNHWILFTDADVLHPTTSISRLLAKATADELDLVSVLVKLRTRELWERLLIPPVLYFFQLLHPFRRVSDPSSRVAAAAGGLLLVRRSLLEEAGGLETIGSRQVDDVVLAGRIKEVGGRCWLGLDPDTRSLRTYVSLGEVARMVSRTAFQRLGRRYLLVPVVMLLLLVGFVLPPVLAIYGAVVFDPLVGVTAAVAWLLMTLHFFPVVQYLGVPGGYVFTLPIAALLVSWMTLQSAWRHMTGRSTPWRETSEVGSHTP